MRPTPGELAQGIRAMLREASAELTSVAAKAQIRRIMSILRDARWDDTAFDLLHENKLLAGMLTALAPNNGEAVDYDVPHNFAAANAMNLALRTAVAAQLDALRHGDLAATADLRRALALSFLERS